MILENEKIKKLIKSGDLGTLIVDLSFLSGSVKPYSYKIQLNYGIYN
jgi:hypothetical protein